MLNADLFLLLCLLFFLFFFFNDTATTEIYTLSLHDALPIFDELHRVVDGRQRREGAAGAVDVDRDVPVGVDRKSTRLNSSHVEISYAVFCLKKKKKKTAELSGERTVQTEHLQILWADRQSSA